MTRFSHRLRRMMDEQQATIGAIAAKTGLPDVKIWDFLQERAVPGEKTAYRIARALGQSPVALLPSMPPLKLVEPVRPGGATSREKVRRIYTPFRHQEAESVPTPTSPLEHVALGQDALVRLLIREGVITEDEWDVKVAEVIGRPE